MKSIATCLKIVGLMACGASLCLSASAQSPSAPAPKLVAPRVAVFVQNGFPFNMVSPLTTPKRIAQELQAAQVSTDVLDAAALRDAGRFNINRYAAVILPYGNNFPRVAFDNLRAFHRAGGCLITSGVPFTHPVINISAQSWRADPRWNADVRVVEQSHGGKSALQLTEPGIDWVGVHSPRQQVLAGQKITVSAWAQSVSGENNGKDFLYVRFFDARGEFFYQEGANLTMGSDWQFLSATVTVPTQATAFDVAPQVRSAKRVIRLDDIAVSVEGKKVAMPNAGFEDSGVDWEDLGHVNELNGFGTDGIGVGGFSAAVPGSVTVAPNDPLRLRSMNRAWPSNLGVQSIDVENLPATVQVKPILLESGHPLAAMLIHRGGEFKGAVDVRTHHPSTEDLDGYDTQQMLVRGAIAALGEKGLLSAQKQNAAFSALAKLPRPRLWTNVVLPKVPRPYQTLQPKSPPLARHLYVVDVRSLKSDERLALVCLQGIVNRKQPRIYLLTNEDNEFWLEELQRQKATDTPIVVADPLSLVEKFRGEIQGAVVPDPNVYTSACVATTLAGLDNLLISTPELAQRLNLPIRVDLRGRFRSNADALRFTRETLLPRANKYLSMCVDPPILENGAIDQIIAGKGVVFWITGPKQQILPGANTADELEEIKALLAAMPLNAIVRGFWWHGDGNGMDENFGVALGSRFGKITVVSDLIQNFSVYSGVPSAPLKQSFKPAPALDKSKVYLSFTMSDGDNIVTWPGYFRNYFSDPLHGTIPIGWGMAPTLGEVAPTMARWFYEHATPNDEFICDVSGVGYIYSPDWGKTLKDRDGAFRSFYDMTNGAMQRMDMKTIRLMNVGTPDIPRVGKLLPDVAFLMPDYGFSGAKSYGELTYTLPTGQPVFRAAVGAEGGAQNMADQIRRRVGTQRPAFVNSFVWNWGSKLSDLKEMLEILGPEYVAVTPSQLNALYRESQQSTPPAK